MRNPATYTDDLMASASRSSVKRLITGVVLLNIVVASLIGATLLRNKLHYEERATITTQNISLVLDEHISGTIDKVDVALQAVSDEAGRQLANGGIKNDSLNTYIVRAHARLPELVALRATNAAGDALYGATVTPAKTSSLAHRDYFKKLRDNPKAGLAISKPLIGGITGKWMIVLSRRINAPDGSFAGLVYAGVSLDYLTQDFSRINVGHRGSISLFDSDFTLIARHPMPAAPYKDTNMKAGSVEFIELVRSGKTSGTYNSTSNLDSQDRLYSFRTLKFTPSLHIVVGQARTDYMADWYQETLLLTLFMAVFLAVTTTASRLFHLQWRKNRQAELAIVNSENKFRTFVENANDVIYAMSADGLFTYVSPNCHDLLGYRADELIGRSFEHIIMREDLPSALAVLHAMLSNKLKQSGQEFRLIHRDGTIRWVAINSSPLINQLDDSMQLFGIAHDITERKQYEERLLAVNNELEERVQTRTAEVEEAKSHLEAMINALPDLMFRIDRGGRILEFRASSHNLLYVAPEQFLGKRFQEVLPPEAAAIIESALSEAATVGNHRGGIYSLSIGQATNWFEISIAAMHRAANDEAQFIMLARDITARKQSEQAILRSEQRLNKAQEIAHIGGWELDLSTGELYWTDEVYRIFGLHPQEFAATYEAFLEAVHPDDRNAVNEAFQLSLTDNLDEYEFAHHVVRKQSGEIRFVHEKCYHERNEQGEIIRSIGIVHDITERKYIEEALTESNNRFLSVFRNAPTMMAICTLEDGICLDVNQRFSTITGFTKEDALGVSFVELGLLSADEFDKLKSAVQEDSQVFDLELECRSSEQRLLICTYSGQLIQLSGKQFLLISAMDITEQRKTEQQLRHSQKMESVGRLAGGVAHDFNNKLSVIMGYTELAKYDLPDTTNLSSYLAEISRAAEHSRDITAQLLAFSRQQIVSPLIIDMNANIEHTQKSLAYLIGENISIVFRPCSDLWRVKIDPVQIEQIIMNLTINARDAMPNGGVLTIETANFNAPPESTSGTHFPKDEYALLTVSDTGTGMDENTISHIFEPFFTTKELGKGTGLGLATIHGIITQNDGIIEVDSTPDEGTTFRIYLPRAAEQPAMCLLPDTELADTGGRILLVEDELTVRKITATILERQGYHVVSCPGADEAIECCRTAQPPFDLILTDIVMPGMNGRDMIRLIRMYNSTAKVLYMSGYTADIIKQSGVSSEEFSFIQKPLDMNELNRKIRELLRR